MKEREVWMDRIIMMLKDADVRTLQMVYYFIVGLKKREERLKK